MKNLFDFDLLVNDVFYRSLHILDYIEKYPSLSDLDKETISATIMDALVYKGLIDSSRQSLDLENLMIVDNLNYYCYTKHPNVSGIPLWMKEMFRTKSMTITGSIPAAIFLAKPSSDAHYCVYDPNTAVSAFFDNFRFILADYDSPTRIGEKAKDRPFVEIEIDGISYLVDNLTKRIFKSEYFIKTYNLIEKNSIRKSEFDHKRKAYYKEQTTPKLDLGSYLSFSLPMFEVLKHVPKFAEMDYEIEKTKEYCPEGWKNLEEINSHMELLKNNF